MADETAAPLPWPPMAGWDEVVGLRIVRASRDEVVAKYEPGSELAGEPVGVKRG